MWHRRRGTEAPRRHGVAPRHGLRLAHGSITKWSACRSPETRRIAEYIDSAMRIAQAGVPGPVFLEMPLDLLMNMHDDADQAATEALAEPPRPAGDPRMIERAAALLKESQKPVFLIGSQLRWSPKRDAVKRAADAWAAPFYLNGMARARPSLRASVFVFAFAFQRAALAQADVAFVFGTPFDFRLDYGRSIGSAKIVQVDLDGAELGRNRKIDVAIHGDTGPRARSTFVGASEEGIRKEWLTTIRADCRNEAARKNARRNRDRTIHRRRPLRCLCGARKTSSRKMTS